MGYDGDISHNITYDQLKIHKNKNYFKYSVNTL